MKIAICMSGLARTFKKCYKSYLDNIINLYDCDVFTFVSKDSNSDDMNLIKQTKIVMCEKEPFHDEKDYILYKARKTRKYSIQGWLSQFWKIKKCHELMLDYQKENNVKYDWVIRCRPDLMITRKLDDLALLNKDMLYVPIYEKEIEQRIPNCYDKDYIYDYIANGGYMPDQLAISSIELMDIYARRYDDLDKIIHLEKIHLFCAEHSIGRQLRYHNIKVKFLKPLTKLQR